MGELANCSRCGEVFVKTTRDICHNCYQLEEKAFNTVYKFLSIRKHRQATIPEIVEATGVEEELIFKFIKQKRLRNSDFPNLTYPCERCGKPISSGKICQECKQEIEKEIQFQEEIDKKAEEVTKEQQNKSIYFALGNESDKE